MLRCGPLRREPVDPRDRLRVPFGAMAQEYLVVRGAREHNLKNISVSIPRNRLTVITGLSGSGKSSLAFDTIYAEGQRRYVESLSAYARQFLGLMEKPDVDAIEGLSPAISIEQKTTGQNPRSTVGTVTEIYDYLRLLWARVGMPHCPNDGTPVTRQSAAQITDSVLAWPAETRIEVLAPIVRGRKGEFRDLLDDVRKRGFVRVRVDGETYDLADVPALNRRQNHDVAVVVDRLVVRADDRSRLTDSIETALKTADGIVEVVRYGRSPSERESVTFSERFACPVCGLSLPELEPRQFSFNSPFGACPDCHGVGTRREVNADLVLGDASISILEGVVLPWGEPTGYLRKVVLPTLAKAFKFDLNAPWGEHSAAAQHALLYGAPGRFKFQTDGARGRGEYESDWEGVLRNVERRYKRVVQRRGARVARGIHDRAAVPDLRRQAAQGGEPGGSGGRAWNRRCGGPARRASHRLLREHPAPRRARRGRLRRPSCQCDQRPAGGVDAEIAGPILKEVTDRLRFLRDVGLDYLTLGRGATSLSGGETQRIRLATQIGSRLVGVLYILDEPSIGLHQRDNERLLATLRGLRDLGNTVIVVEHDAETIAAADHVIDLGPRAGRFGGEVIAEGTFEEIRQHPDLAHGSLPPERAPRAGAGRPARGREAKHRLRIIGARANNLQNLTVDIPLGAVRRGHRGVRLGQVDAGHRHPVPGAGPPLLSRQGRPRGAHADRGAGPDRQGDRHRPEPDRPDAAVQSGHLHGTVHADPRAVHPAAGCQDARLRARALLVQREGRALRGVPGRRAGQDRDALPARRVRAVRGLQRPALQPRDAGGALQGAEHRRRARSDGGGRARLLQQPAPDRGEARAAERRRAGLHPPGPGGHHALAAARRSGSSSPPSWPSGTPAARCTSSTSRPPVSTSRTSGCCSRCCTGWSTRATVWW